METNAPSIMDAGGEIANQLFQTMTDGLGGFVETVIDENWSSQISTLLGELIVAFLVIWGVFWVARKLIRAARSTR